MRTHTKVRRRLPALVAAAVAAFFLGAVPAYADNGPHVSTATNTATTGNAVKLSDAGQGRCASCHRAHTARAAVLLNATSEKALCYSCHGDGGTGATTDVQSGLGYDAASTTTYPGTTTTLTVDRATTVAGALRGGGFDKAALDSGNASKDMALSGTGFSSSRANINQVIPALTTPATATSSHLGDGNIMWGNGAIAGTATANPGKVMATKLECTSCHDPHGNGQYRILRPVPSDSGFATSTGTNTQPGVFIKDTTNKVYTTANYWITGDPAAVLDTGTKTILGATSITDPTPKEKTITTTVSSFQANVAAWCTTCHTRYLAPSGANSTTSGDAVFTYRHTGDNVNSDAPINGTSAGNRNCIQCHVAHGSNAAMPNSKVESPGGTVTSSDSRLLRVDDRGVCVMCHNV